MAKIFKKIWININDIKDTVVIIYLDTYVVTAFTNPLSNPLSIHIFIKCIIVLVHW